MHIPDTGEIITPVDDPFQFEPAWRSSVANYLFGCGASTAQDFEFIFKFGGLPLVVEEDCEDEEEGADKRSKKSKKSAKSKKKDTPRKKRKKTIVRPLYPFDSSAEYRCFAADKWIISLVGVIDAISRGYPSTKEDAGIRLAMRWYEEKDHEAAMKKRLEPLLLTEIGIDVITLDLLGIASAQPAIEAYERLYYNCRDEDWKRNPSGQLIQRFAMPYGPLKTFLRKYEEVDLEGFIIGDGRPLAKESDIWRAIAATLGYDALMYAWKWDKFAHGMENNSVENMIDVAWKVSVSRMLSSLYTGDVAPEDIARLLAAFTAQSKKISDDRNNSTGGEEGDTTKALLAILRLTSPKMVAFTETDQKSKNEEIQSRIASQMAISKTVIEDKGPQINAEVMDAQISNAISV